VPIDKNDQMGLFRSDAEIELKQIPINVLKENLNSICNVILDALRDLNRIEPYKLKEVTLQVEVSANGGINLIGTANLGGKGAISLKFSE